MGHNIGKDFDKIEISQNLYIITQPFTLAHSDILHYELLSENHYYFYVAIVWVQIRAYRGGERNEQ